VVCGQQLTPPSVSAEGDQVYCPNSDQLIVSNLEIENLDPSILNSVYIQISIGYISSEDILKLNGTHPNIKSLWDPNEAKLTLTTKSAGEISNQDLISAVKDVVFYSKNPNPDIDKSFSISLGSANYLPSTGHYYEFFPSVSIPWTDAKRLAENKSYYGIKGYLVTILSQEEADISGKLTNGVGWIGGSDAEEEGTWKWVTGPEAGTVFWIGNSSGSSDNYANWNDGEPNNAGNEDYAHITDPTIGFEGSWNDLANSAASSGPYQSKGYMVEYGGSSGDPILKFTATTKLIMPKLISFSEGEACYGDPITLSANASHSKINWYKVPEGGEIIYSGNSVVVNTETTTTYWIDIIPGDCVDETRTPITATVHQYPVIKEKNLIIEQCDNDSENDGKTLFNLNVFNPLISKNYNNEIFEFYSDSTRNNNSIISNPSKYFNTDFEDNIYVKIISSFGCSETSKLTLKVAASLIDSEFYLEYEKCETEIKTLEPGIEKWDISTLELISKELVNSDPKFSAQNINITFYFNENDAYLRQNKIKNENNQFEMLNPYSQEIWARVDNIDLNQISCLGIKKIANLKIKKLPEFEWLNSFEIVCLNLDPVLIGVDATDDRNYEYRWYKDGTLLNEGDEGRILIKEGGKYEVLASTTTGTLCSKSISIELFSSEIASVSQNDLSVTDPEGDTGAVKINTNNLGVGDYEFAIDDSLGIYKDFPYFDNLLPGIHNIYIRDKNDCGMVQIESSILGHMKFFSPNGDGINDYWNVLGVSENFQPKTKVYIYDRRGKLLKDLNPLSIGWDGTYNGLSLPQDDYWFHVYFENGKSYSGHFSLLRR
tara:strand:+ start:11231 stop:13714 length:2484 start_codon:yes stop_codon:yes gene_type:complete